jgi:hypothetical protein
LENFHLSNLSLEVKLLLFNVLLVVGGAIGNQLQGVRVMVFNATFNNISVISWQLKSITNAGQISEVWIY